MQLHHPYPCTRTCLRGCSFVPPSRCGASSQPCCPQTANDRDSNDATRLGKLEQCWTQRNPMAYVSMKGHADAVGIRRRVRSRVVYCTFAPNIVSSNYHCKKLSECLPTLPLRLPRSSLQLRRQSHWGRQTRRRLVPKPRRQKPRRQRQPRKMTPQKR